MAHRIRITTVVWIMASVQIQGQPVSGLPQDLPSSREVSVEKDSTRKRLKTVVAVVSATASLTSAVLAYRFMSRADAAYEQYRHAGHPDDMDRYFREAEFFDRKAGFSLALFEVFFALAVYSGLSLAVGEGTGG